MTETTTTRLTRGRFRCRPHLFVECSATVSYCVKCGARQEVIELRKNERLADDDIVGHLRRFGGLTTAQLSVQLGVPKRSLVNRLNRLNRNRRIARKSQGKSFLWSAA